MLPSSLALRNIAPACSHVMTLVSDRGDANDAPLIAVCGQDNRCTYICAAYVYVRVCVYLRCVEVICSISLFQGVLNIMQWGTVRCV